MVSSQNYRTLRQPRKSDPLHGAIPVPGRRCRPGQDTETTSGPITRCLISRRLIPPIAFLEPRTGRRAGKDRGLRPTEAQRAWQKLCTGSFTDRKSRRMTSRLRKDGRPIWPYKPEHRWIWTPSSSGPRGLMPGVWENWTSQGWEFTTRPINVRLLTYLLGQSKGIGHVPVRYGPKRLVSLLRTRLCANSLFNRENTGNFCRFDLKSAESGRPRR